MSLVYILTISTEVKIIIDINLTYKENLLFVLNVSTRVVEY